MDMNTYIFSRFHPKRSDKHTAETAAGSSNGMHGVLFPATEQGLRCDFTRRRQVCWRVGGRMAHSGREAGRGGGARLLVSMTKQWQQ